MCTTQRKTPGKAGRFCMDVAEGEGRDDRWYPPMGATDTVPLEQASTGHAYQVRRGPTVHWVSPPLAILTSAPMPQDWLNFTWAPRRP